MPAFQWTTTRRSMCVLSASDLVVAPAGSASVRQLASTVVGVMAATRTGRRDEWTYKPCIGRTGEQWHKD